MAYALIVDGGPMRAIIWLLSFVPVAAFTFLVLERMSDTLPPDSAERSVFGTAAPIGDRLGQAA